MKKSGFRALIGLVVVVIVVILVYKTVEKTRQNLVFPHCRPLWKQANITLP